MVFDDDSLEIEPNATFLIQSIRDMGYTLETAISEIIDNSISAKATKIEIICNWDGNEPFIEVKDDGIGMDIDQLKEAMRLGSNPTSKRDPEDLGRFGLGLKTASFSQSKRLIVKTRTEKLNDYTATWDLDIVEEKGKWLLDLETSNHGDLFKEHGTIVRWEKIDTLETKDKNKSEKLHEEVTTQLIKHISLIFHRYISGEYERKIIFIINGKKL